jgi:tryptophan-rich sensory protein
MMKHLMLLKIEVMKLLTLHHLASLLLVPSFAWQG